MPDPRPSRLPEREHLKRLALELIEEGQKLQERGTSLLAVLDPDFKTKSVVSPNDLRRLAGLDGEIP